MAMILPFLQNTVIRLALRSPAWRTVFRVPYRILIAKLRFFQRLVPVRALSLRQGLLEPDWIPGASDVDVIWILRTSGDEKSVVRRIWRMMRLLKRFFPMLGEVLIADEDELRFFDQWGDGKTQNRAGWRLIRGDDTPPDQENRSVPPWKTAWDHWTRALMSYHLLVRNYLNPAESISAVRALSVQKHFLDICRHLRGMDAPYESRSVARESILRNEGVFAPTDVSAVSRDPLSLSLSEIARLCAVSNSLLGQKGQNVYRRLASGNTDLSKILRWDSNRTRNDWEVQAWRKRFLQLQDRLQGSAAALFCNTLTHSTLVLKDGMSDDSFVELLAETRQFKKTDRGLQGPMEFMGGAVYRMSLCCSVQGHPFSYFTHDRSLGEDAFHADDIAGGNILIQCRSERMDIPVPPLETLSHLARASLAEFLPSWRTLDHPFSDSDAFYSLYLWLTTALSLKLFLEKGLLGNPEDLEGLTTKAVLLYPEHRVLSASPTNIDRRRLNRFFYDHYQELHSLLTDTARVVSIV